MWFCIAFGQITEVFTKFLINLVLHCEISLDVVFFNLSDAQGEQKQ